MDLFLLAVQQMKQQGISLAGEFLLKVLCVLALAHGIDIFPQNAFYQEINIFF